MLILTRVRGHSLGEFQFSLCKIISLILWTISLKRGPDGRFSDDDLAGILQDATEKPAASYRARGTPGVLKIIEILGMEQARAWGVCTFNEFRKFLGLKVLESFEEWNPDPVIAVRIQFILLLCNGSLTI